MSKYAYKLLKGRHVVGTKNPRLMKIKGPRREFKQGDVIHTDVDLLRKFGESAKAKFMPMQVAEAPPAEEPKQESFEDLGEYDEVEDDDQEPDDGLDDMTIKELRAYAKQHNVEIGAAHKKKTLSTSFVTS